MFDYSGLYQYLSESGMSKFSKYLENKLPVYTADVRHGDFNRWETAISNLPEIKPSQIIFDEDTVLIGRSTDIDEKTGQIIKNQLISLMPWRKGPFNWFGVKVDAEWQSNIKWNRVKNSGVSIKDHRVLDIGAGNGYYALRMLGDNARYVLGIDPTLLFIMQFMAVKKYIPDLQAEILPLSIEDMPDFGLEFDSVFSMGVIYHRKDPQAHLDALFSFLKKGGQLILESLIIENKDILVPTERYAKMNNVWNIPSINKLFEWTKHAGFINMDFIDVSVTTVMEQRKTEWMQYESLQDFLDPDNNCLTIEGYPAPKRALLKAYKP